MQWYQRNNSILTTTVLALIFTLIDANIKVNYINRYDVEEHDKVIITYVLLIY